MRLSIPRAMASQRSSTVLGANFFKEAFSFGENDCQTLGEIYTHMVEGRLVAGGPLPGTSLVGISFKGLDRRRCARPAPRSRPILINAARGKVVNEAALIQTMKSGAIAGAGIDATPEEPLPAASPLWDLPNTFITPHSAGETRKYEDNVLDILQDNLDRLWKGEAKLRNQIV